MTDKPKITHFAASNWSDSKVLKGDSQDRSRLARLYPKPKTYEQRKRDDILRQKSYRRQWPKHPHLNIAAYGSAILGLTVWFIQNLNDSWFGNSNKGLIMSTVFLSFAVGIVLVFLIIAWVNYVNKQFSYFGGLASVFWLFYAVSVAVLLALWLSGWIWDYTNILWIPVLIVLHFIIAFFSTRRIVGKIS